MLPGTALSHQPQRVMLGARAGSWLCSPLPQSQLRDLRQVPTVPPSTQGVTADHALQDQDSQPGFNPDFKHPWAHLGIASQV